jgi:hypothetical protein
MRYKTKVSLPEMGMITSDGLLKILIGMKIILRNISMILMLAYNTSACQSPRYYYLHFSDKEAETFCYSDTTLVKSIDTCYKVNDTLFFVLKVPLLTKANNMEYYCTYRNNKNRKTYLEILPILDSYSRNNISHIVLKNYYCTRYFKRKRGSHYFQVSSVNFSSRWINY